MREARTVIAFDRPSMYLLVDKARNICFTASNNRRVKIVACMIDVEGCLPISFVSSVLTYHNRQLEKRRPISLLSAKRHIEANPRSFCPFLFKRVIKIVRISQPEEIIDDFVSRYPVNRNQQRWTYAAGLQSV